MHSTGEVETYPFCVPPCLPEDRSAVISQTHSGAVEKGVLGVVLHAVVDNEVEVILKLIQALISMGVNAFSHCREVHGVLDVVQIIRNLYARGKSNIEQNYKLYVHSKNLETPAHSIFSQLL